MVRELSDQNGMNKLLRGDICIGDKILAGLLFCDRSVEHVDQDLTSFAGCGFGRIQIDFKSVCHVVKITHAVMNR
jgi:hypothetical protein